MSKLPVVGDLSRLDKKLTYHQLIEDVAQNAEEKVKTEDRWDSYVLAAKKLLTATYFNRMAIAEVACRAVRVVRGGNRQTKERVEIIQSLSVTSFANEIGVRPNTLNLWIRIKLDVFDRLDANDQLMFKHDAGEKAHKRLGAKKAYEPAVVQKTYKKFAELTKREKATMRIFRDVSAIKKFFLKTEYPHQLTDEQLEKLNFSLRTMLKRVVELQDIRKKGRKK